MNPNFLFLNRGDGTFEDVSETSGAAYDINGMAQSGMGVDAEDVDGDGLPELFVTNFANEYNTLYLNFGKGVFFDNTAFFGLASDTMPWVEVGDGPGRLRQRRLARQLRRPTATSTTTAASSASRSTTRRSPCSSATWTGKRFRLVDPGCRALLRHEPRRPRGGLRRHRQRRRHRHRGQPQGPACRLPAQRHADQEPLDPPGPPGDQEQPRRDRYPGRVQTVRRSRRRDGKARSGRSTASARGASAWSRPTTPGC